MVKWQAQSTRKTTLTLYREDVGRVKRIRMSQALRRCPQLVVMPVRGERYHEISQRIMRILGYHTPLLEQVSVDEAYLDLTNWLPAGVTPEAMARQVKAEILQETGLTCSVGVATGKGISKIASDLQKPDGLVMVPPGEEAAFLAPLAIGKLRGVGEATEKKLRELGIQTIGDLAKLPVEFLEAKFGVHGRGLLALARGMDDSPVVPEREAKSIGREVTYLTDVAQRDILERTLLELSEDVGESLRRHGLLARGVTLKLRYGDFHTITRAMTLPESADTTEAIYQAALTLLRQTNPARAVRLIGVTSGPLQPVTDRQLSLFADKPTEKDRKVADAMDAIRDRFGTGAIMRARLVKKRREDDSSS